MSNQLPSVRAARSALALVLLVACSEDPKVEWVSVSSTKVGGVTSLSLDAQGHFIGVERLLGPLQSGADPTVPWEVVPGLGEAAEKNLRGPLRHPMVVVGDRVKQSTPEGWVDRGPASLPGTYDSVLAADEKGRLLVTVGASTFGRYAGNALEVLYTSPSRPIGTLTTSPSGDLYELDLSQSAAEIYLLEKGARTPLLGTLGCAGAAATCIRGANIIGFDDAGATYFMVIAKEKGEPFAPYQRFFRRSGGTFSELPRSGPVDVVLGASCSVTSEGAIYCTHLTPATDTEPLDVYGMVRLDPGATEWSELGPLPERALCRVVGRNDGRIALTCTALAGTNNDSLYVSR